MGDGAGTFSVSSTSWLRSSRKIERKSRKLERKLAIGGFVGAETVVGGGTGAGVGFGTGANVGGGEGGKMGARVGGSGLPGTKPQVNRLGKKESQ